MKQLIFALVLSFSVTVAFSQSADKPKLVVGIVVDQMKYDFINMYWKHYGDGGFKRMIGEGFSCRNLHYNYGPTFTGPGHASIFTGTTPRYHGIVANDWYDKKANRTIYCSEDRSVKSVGDETPSGQMSPKNMLVTTMTDELKMSTAGRSKVISVSIKDRGATLPGGHSADAAYWMTDKWISSTHYMEQLPEWVVKFNEGMEQFVPDVWNTLLPIESYLESWGDDNEYEYSFRGKDRPVFPYDLKTLRPENGNISMIKSTPFGNTITTEFAKAAIRNEKLGANDITDFITISYSSPDYIGHMFGPQAVETQDNYLRFDAELAEFLNFLDAEIGKGEYLVFLTADHGGAMVPAHLEDLKMPGGNIDAKLINNAAKEFLIQRYNADGMILNYSNDQFFLDHDRIAENGYEPEQIARALADFVLQFGGVAEAYTARDLKRAQFTEGTIAAAQRGFNHRRSGDVILLFQSGWIEYGRRGTTHGSLHAYDTHVPAIFMGWGVKHGFTDRRLSITDIAPTVCSLLQIGMPSGFTGDPIRQITER